MEHHFLILSCLYLFALVNPQVVSTDGGANFATRFLHCQ